MTGDHPGPSGEIRRERQQRVRIGVTGLAFIFVLVLLAASFAGTASNEPELTADARTESGPGNEVAAATGTADAPQDPLAEIGVAPGAALGGEGESPEGAEDADPSEPGVANSLDELDAQSDAR